MSVQAIKAHPNYTRQILKLFFDPFHYLLKFSLFTLIVWVALSFGSQRIEVVGESMQPSFFTGDRLLINTLAYRWSEPARGDVVSLYVPGQDSMVAVKRIIGLPGEIVRVSNGVLTINGAVYEEPYISDSMLYQGEWFVPEGSYFLLGDNRNISLDSHIWGPVNADKLIGSAVTKYWSAATTDSLETLVSNFLNNIPDMRSSKATQGFEACLFEWVCIAQKTG